MDKYLAAEKELTEVVNYGDIKIGTGFGMGTPTLYAFMPGTGEVRGSLPRWARDDATAFQLMTEHEVWPTIDLNGTVSVREEGSSSRIASTTLDEHADKDSAVRYAIVNAVIAKLRAAQKTA